MKKEKKGVEQENIMSKKQIIVLIVVGLILFAATFLGVYLLRTNDDGKIEKKKIKPKNAIVLKDYTVAYGTYIGEEKEYNPDTKKIESQKVKIEVTKDTINNQKYTVKNNSIYIDGFELYEVKKNNEFTLLAGAGTDYKLEK
jgi:flagellar basal body-associated protein FliL